MTLTDNCLAQLSVGHQQFVLHHTVLACKVAGVIASFIPLICLNSYMAGKDQCYMHLMYVGNTDAQISKVHNMVALHVVGYYP